MIIISNNIYSFIAPSAAPSGLAIDVINSTALNITWSDPPVDKINGIIEYYSIKVHVSDTAEDLLYTSDTTSLVLGGLHPYYTHTVFVAAFTVAIGPYTAAESAQTLADGMYIIDIKNVIINTVSCFSSKWSTSECFRCCYQFD